MGFFSLRATGGRLRGLLGVAIFGMRGVRNGGRELFRRPDAFDIRGVMSSEFPNSTRKLIKTGNGRQADQHRGIQRRP